MPILGRHWFITGIIENYKAVIIYMHGRTVDDHGLKAILTQWDITRVRVTILYKVLLVKIISILSALAIFFSFNNFAIFAKKR